jgi:hypothetical protein
MKVSQLIEHLENVPATHGNLLVLVHDGLDPSDFWPIETVTVEKDETWLALGKVVNIRS